VRYCSLTTDSLWPVGTAAYREVRLVKEVS
ncbi:hypothetical protein LCGC14_3159860, partial [marine sediment metagenome]